MSTTKQNGGGEGLLTVGDLTLWSVSQIKDYLGCGRSTVYRYMADPDFPKAHRGPGGGHPRWLAAQVQAWYLHRQDAKAA